MQPTEPNNLGDGPEPQTPPSPEPTPAQGYVDVQTASVQTAPSDSISWEASEYLQHDNGIGWYIGFFVVAAILVGFAIFFQVWTFIPVVIVIAIAGIIHVRRPPRTLHYRLDDSGLEIEGQPHAFSAYKSFSVIRDGAFFALLLIPVKRFSPSTVVYFDETDGEYIVDVVGSFLTMEDRGLDTLDKFLRLIRF